MDAMNAYTAYGYSGLMPSRADVAPETQTGTGIGIPAGAIPKLPLGWNNPLFWLLVLFLIFSGYLYGGFSIGLKRIGSNTVKIGG